MDEAKYMTLAEALADIPDPRKRRGQRYPWKLLLILISAALGSGQQNGRGIAQWVREQGEQLGRLLGRPGKPLPSEATLRRAARALDVGALEERIGQFAAGLPMPQETTPWHGLALDGKEVRGAGAHGQPVHLVALARHNGAVLAQRAVSAKSNEIPAAAELLAGRDLRGWVVTTDALLAQRNLAKQIRTQGGHYLMVIKDNQPATHEAIATLFAEPPWHPTANPQEYQAHRTVEKAHGRLETRLLEASPLLNSWLHWPGVGQVLRRASRRILLATGEISTEVTYAITSLTSQEATAAQLAALWRGHWTIENRVHRVRDVTLGEDAGQAHRGATPQVMAALRNALLSLLRARGWTNIADALRYYSATPQRALALIGALPAGL